MGEPGNMKQDGFEDCATNPLTSHNINIYSSVWWHCLSWAPGARMIPNPSFPFNRLCWQWEQRHVAEGQVMTLLMDVAATTKGIQLTIAVHIKADNVSAPSLICQVSSILLADNTEKKIHFVLRHDLPWAPSVELTHNTIWLDKRAR